VVKTRALFFCHERLARNKAALSSPQVDVEESRETATDEEVKLILRVEEEEVESWLGWCKDKWLW